MNFIDLIALRTYIVDNDMDGYITNIMSDYDIRYDKINYIQFTLSKETEDLGFPHIITNVIRFSYDTCKLDFIKGWIKEYRKKIDEEYSYGGEI